MRLCGVIGGSYENRKGNQRRTETACERSRQIPFGQRKVSKGKRKILGDPLGDGMGERPVKGGIEMYVCKTCGQWIGEPIVREDETDSAEYELYCPFCGSDEVSFIDEDYGSDR